MKALPVFLLLMATACTDKTPGNSAVREPDRAASEALTDTIDRARAVEETLRDSATARRAQLDEAE